MKNRLERSAREQLTRKAIDGEHDALLRLIEVVQPDIRRFARAQCKAVDVEDAAQEALWLLYRRVGMIRTAEALPGWLFTTIRRECLRIARLALRHEATSAAFQESRLANRSTVDLRLDVAAAIESLPEHYRQIVVLRDFEELTIDEIGSTLRLTRESLKGRLHRARALLRKCLLQDETA